MMYNFPRNNIQTGKGHDRTVESVKSACHCLSILQGHVVTEMSTSGVASNSVPHPLPHRKHHTDHQSRRPIL